MSNRCMMGMCATLLGWWCLASGWLAAAERLPNIVVIISDDQGYADISFNPHHPPEVSTPHLDELARNGVFFSQAYTSGAVCSPTRAGLMLGRYQQRVGVYTAGEGGRGFDPTIPIFPAMLPEQYVSTAIGKWHLGLDQDYPELKWHAINRGFDECYKFMGRGGHDYFQLSGASGSDETGPIYRGKERIDDKGYLTTRLTEEAVDFIDRHRQQPFFLYLAYNAVHAPAQAPQATIERIRQQFPDLDPQRQILMAMLDHLDRGVGAVIEKLKEEAIFDNTLLFFLTDNGGAKNMGANNAPLRGFKASFYEGGIRTPLIVSWPDKVRGGRTIDTPVISLDILPTCLDAIGAKPPEGALFDGKSLLPLMTKGATDHHQTLYWSNGSDGSWAIRRGDWKLHSAKGNLELVDLAEDTAEQFNLAEKHPDRVKQLVALYDAWLETMAPSLATGKKPSADVRPQPNTEREKLRQQRRIERKKQQSAEAEANKPASPANAPSAPRYNVLLIMADDLRCALGCYGDKQAKTPNIDRLAERGVLFERAYVQYPVCNASRTSMLTSTRPEANGVTGNQMFFREQLPDAVTLPQLYRQHGGRSLSYGKIFHAGQVEGEIQDRLLDVGKSWDDAQMFKPTATGNRGQKRNLTGGALKWCAVGAMEGSDDDQSDGQTSLHAIAAMETTGGRWFIGAGFHRPHDPFLVARQYVAMFPSGSLQLYRDPAEATELPKLALGGGAFQAAFEKFSDDERMAFLTHYYAGAAQTDAQVGRLMETLDRQNLWDSTVVVFVGDHGYHLGERNWWNKNTLFERSCRAPCIIVAPGVKPAVSRSLVEFMDIYPTVAELCDLRTPEHVEGHSLVPVLNNPAQHVRDAAITYVQRGSSHGHSLRTNHWRYTEWTDGSRELYDHDTDPEETHDVSQSAEHVALISQLSKRLRMRNSVGAALKPQ